MSATSALASLPYLFKAIMNGIVPSVHRNHYQLLAIFPFNLYVFIFERMHLNDLYILAILSKNQ